MRRMTTTFAIAALLTLVACGEAELGQAKDKTKQAMITIGQKSAEWSKQAKESFKSQDFKIDDFRNGLQQQEKALEEQLKKLGDASAEKSKEAIELTKRAWQESISSLEEAANDAGNSEAAAAARESWERMKQKLEEASPAVTE